MYIRIRIPKYISLFRERVYANNTDVYVSLMYGGVAGVDPFDPFKESVTLTSDRVNLLDISLA